MQSFVRETTGHSGFIDEKDRQLARILSTLIWASGGIYLLVIVIALFLNDSKIVAVALAGCALLSVPLVLLKRQDLRAGSFAFVLFALVTVTAIATVGQGIRDTALVAFPIIFIFAGLTLERRLFRVCVGLALAAISWLAIGEMYGWLVTKPFDGAMANVFLLIIASILFLIAALAVELLAMNMRRNLARAENEIAQRKQAEENLRESEEIFNQFMAHSPVHVYIKDDKLRLLKVSNSFEELLGKPTSELLGKDSYDLLPPEFAKSAIVDDLKTLKGGMVVRAEETLNGRVYSTIKFPIYGETGKPDYLGGFSVDITERKRAEEAIAVEKERLAVTLRSIGDGVITTDTKGNVVIMNKVAEELTGWKQNDAQGKPITSVFTIINENTRKPHENPVEKVLANGQIIELENHTLLISRDGTERVVADSGAPIKDESDVTIGVVLVFRDITEKQILVETTQRNQKLESLGLIAGGIAHNFNNLMGAVFGYIDMASEASKDDKVRRYLSKAGNSIDRAKGLTAQLLTFAQGGGPVRQVTPLAPFIHDTAQSTLSRLNVPCTFDIADDLRPCSIDKTQIGQVFDSVIINAHEAMPNGGSIDLSAINVSFEENEHPTLGKGDYVRISFKDYGIGIQRENLSRIFDPFYTTKPMGQGLGLATCHSIVKSHGGAIDVESEPGKGTTFHMYVPASSEIGSSTTAKSATGNLGASGTFIIMDDEEALRETVSDMLEKFGYSVVCKENGRDTVDFYIEETKAERAFAGLILDLTIPRGMGGKATVAEIRKLNTDIPIFVASGYADDPVMKNPAEYGFTASICKPFKKAELSEMLEKYLKGNLT
jgi:PAS domain S-box-containing protein